PPAYAADRVLPSVPTRRSSDLVAAADKADADLAVRAARAALEGPLATQKPSERAKLLWRLADLVEAHADELAVLETLDNGKPLRDRKSTRLNSSHVKISYAAFC